MEHLEVRGELGEWRVGVGVGAGQAVAVDAQPRADQRLRRRRLDALTDVEVRSSIACDSQRDSSWT